MRLVVRRRADAAGDLLAEDAALSEGLMRGKMKWWPLPESELCYAKEDGATYVQTWDGVRVLAGGREAFVPMVEWTEDRGREVARCLIGSTG